MSSRRCPKTRADAGAALVEFALVLPVFALMVFGMAQLGITFAGWSQLRNVVQTAARAASVGALANLPQCGQDAPPGCTLAVEIGLPTGLSPETVTTAVARASAGCSAPLETCSDYSWLDGDYIYHNGAWQLVVNEQSSANGQPLASQVLDLTAFQEGLKAGWACAATDHQGNCTEVATGVTGVAEGALGAAGVAVACRGAPPGSPSCGPGAIVVVCASLPAGDLTGLLPAVHVSTESAFYMETGTATTFSSGDISCG